MDSEILFCVDAKNIIKISNEYLEDISTININDNIIPKTSKIRKIRKNYKHDVGAAQFYKDTNYASNYYNDKKQTIRCTICNSPISTFSLKRHMISKKCLKNTV
jgi:hypothetical protein